jgi:adenylate cyclase
MPGADRQLAAIMFTDIVGYTRLAQAKESLALELLEEHRGDVRPLFPAHGGTEIKTIGDAFLVEFKSALEAVLCAVEIQRKMAERNSKVPSDRRFQLRIGVHLGDVVHDSGDVFGDAVNVASRIEPLADPGGVCISQQVFDNIRNKTEFEIVKMGEVELKNVELPVGVYRVNMEVGESRGRAFRAPRERLAVLPFVNISPDPNDEYFADGLTEELISKLSEIKGLKVLARTSVMNYKKKEKSVSQIGKELEAGSIIEGSVRKAGNRIRVTVQLIDSTTEEHLWASNYDKELDDIFAIQSDVAARVANSISAGFFPAPKKADTDDVEAYTMYIKAMQLVHAAQELSLREAVILFEKAIKRDPSFARAYAGLCLAWHRLASGGYEDFGVVESRAEPAVKKALELDPGSAEAHAAMAGVCNMLDRPAQVVAEAEQAVRINPNLADAYLQLGINHAAMGDLDRSLVSLEKAHELDPLAANISEQLARTSLVAGKPDRAKGVLERMDELTPRNPRILNGLAEYYMVMQDFAKAQELLTKGFEVNAREPLLRLNQGVLYALTGRKQEAEELKKEIMADKAESVSLYGQLFISAALGDLDQAFAALMRQADLHAWPFLIGSLPIFSELRKDSRYAQFAARMGLPH